jgi:hypothetical protein
MAMSSRFAPDATPANGRYELPPSGLGLLVLADPPEAGWRIQGDSGEQDTADAVCAVEDGEHR